MRPRRRWRLFRRVRKGKVEPRRSLVFSRGTRAINPHWSCRGLAQKPLPRERRKEYPWESRVQNNAPFEDYVVIFANPAGEEDGHNSVSLVLSLW
jgi:hypothetical protein